MKSDLQKQFEEVRKAMLSPHLRDARGYMYKDEYRALLKKEKEIKDAAKRGQKGRV